MSIMLYYLSNFIPVIKKFMSNLFKNKKETISICSVDNIYENDYNILLVPDYKDNTYRLIMPIKILMESDEVFWTTINKIYIVNTFSKLRAIELIKSKCKIFMIEEHKNIDNIDIKYIDKRSFKLDNSVTMGIKYIDNPSKYQDNLFKYINNNTREIV